MALSAGTRLGGYEITGQLGTGGMGEVYRAIDTKLGRAVAIKTLPSALAQDPDRLARFEREAKLLAALNHANIASIYGLDAHEGTQYLAMELVEGVTLEQRLKDGPLPLEDALHLALQIAEALEAAHERGVVHRDLKPANIMVTRDGQVKVLDFGLAKASLVGPNQAISAYSPALSLAMTQQGLILGTAGYMSPEQASGQATDQRADIWAFGIVLFEMLTGLPVFSGESVPHILAAVLQTEPDWNRLPKSLHPRLKLLLERCLEKKVGSRYHSIADARVDIEKALSDPRGAGAAADGRATVPARSAASRAAIALGLVAIGAAVTGLVGWRLRPSPSAPRVTRFTDAIEPIGNAPPYLTISRDGSRIAYVAGTPPQLYVRDMGEFSARPVLDDTRDVDRDSPCFSPDGTWIAFATTHNHALSKAPVAGGRPLTLAEGVSGVTACDWADDGNIYFGGDDGILRVSEAGGAAEAVVTPGPDDGEGTYIGPQLLPGGNELLFSIRTGNDRVRVVVRDLKTGQQTTVLEDAGVASFAPTGRDPRRGHLIYGKDGALFAAPIDLSRRRAGTPSQVLDGILGSGPATYGAVSSTGTLAYLAGAFGPGNTLVVVDRQGSQQPLAEQATGTPIEVSISPDGRRGVTRVFDTAAKSMDLWVYDFDGGRQTKVTFGGINGNAVWTRDGKRLIYVNAADYTSPQRELRSVPIDGSGPPVTLRSLQGGVAWPTSVSPDGTTLMGTGSSSGGDNQDIWLLPLDADAAGQTAAADFSYLLTTPFAERYATFSPDGHWVAFSSDESGRDEVYVVPYPGPGPKSKVSIDGGREPRWNPRGGELFYLSGSKLMAVEVQTVPAFRAGVPKALFDDPSTVLPDPGGPPTGFRYDVMPDGARFVMLKHDAGPENGSQLRVVQNWFEELRELAPSAAIN